MELGGKAKRVRIYLSEGDLINHQPAHVAIIGLLRREDAAGATVFRAIEGYGGAGVLHTARFVDRDWHLPMVIEWIDGAERVDRLIPKLKELVARGLITVEETEVVLASPHPVRAVSNRLTAAEVMSGDVISVGRDAPVREVVELLLGRGYRAVPVVDNGVPIGIITNTDLITRGGLSVRLDLLPILDTPELHAELERLSEGGKRAEQVMTPGPVTVQSTALLTHVAQVMCRRRLKRLPVVDGVDALVGMISRVDLLRTVAVGAPAEAEGAPVAGLSADAAVATVMRRDVPTVHPETPLGEVMLAVVSTRLNRAVVIDAERRVVGIVRDAELLERVTPSLRPSALRSLMNRIPFGHPSPALLAQEQHAAARVARDVMITDVVTMRESTPLREVIGAMISKPRKIIPIVDADDRLVGVVDRRDVLHGLV
jgi:CBS domain-containing protein